MKHLIGLLIVLISIFLIKKYLKSIREEIKDKDNSGMVLFVRELFLGAGGIYSLMLIIGVMLLFGIGA